MTTCEMSIYTDQHCMVKAQMILKNVTSSKSKIIILYDLIKKQILKGNDYSLEEIGDYLHSSEIGFSHDGVLQAYEKLTIFFDEHLPTLKGKFITFEGIDGSGKTTNVAWLAGYLRSSGKEVYVTREPGGTHLGERLREILFTNEMDAETEALLMFASRRDHIETVIKPMLEKGIWVISDRFTDSSFALQGFGGGASILGLNDLEKFVHPEFEPDLTILFDLPVEIARERNAGTAKKDRFELMDMAYHERVRQGFLYRKDHSGDRIQLINADQTVEMIRHDIVNIMDNFDERLDANHGHQELLSLVVDPEWNER